MKAFACVYFVITHRAIADVSMICGSDCSLYIGVMQETVRQHYMVGEQTTPGEKGERERENENVDGNLCNLIGA